MGVTYGVPTGLPEADYVVLGSRLALGLDGGFAIAVPARLRLLEAAGASNPLMLSVDGASRAAHAAQRSAFVERGLVPSGDRMRNLYDELAGVPAWLATVGEPGTTTAGVAYRTVMDAAGAPVLSLPVFAADPHWHLTDAAVVVHAADGDRVLRGFRALYIAWLAAIAEERRAAAGDPDRIFVVICESRQIGELLVAWDDPRVRIVHTVHNSHLPAPYDDPHASLDGLWSRWLATVDRYDAVMWPTKAQRDDVVARCGDPGTFFVVPNHIDLGAEPEGPASRDRRRVVMINRLAPQKRVDRALHAWRRIAAAVADARLDIYGDGPLRHDMAVLVEQLGLQASVRLFTGLDDRDAVLDASAVFLTSTAFEGQGLAIAEAMARGVPVVAFDVRYGPNEVIGGGGELVPPGDVDALADAVIELLRDDERRVEMAVAARGAARALALEAVQPRLVEALRFALERPSRRAGAAAR